MRNIGAVSMGEQRICIRKMENDMKKELVIIGGGPAGISASLYTQRAKLKTLVIYKEQSALKG